MRRRWSDATRRVVWLVLACLAVACDGGGGTPDGSSGDGGADGDVDGALDGSGDGDGDGDAEVQRCATREDCAGCLVCKDQECVAEPAVCVGDLDCCLGRRCNFGACLPEPTHCATDADCADPWFPRCVGGTCQQDPNECVSDADCQAGHVCVGRICVTPCSPQTCELGQWCDHRGVCVPGCDADDDCLPPDTCDYSLHACGQTDCCGNACAPDSQYCDPRACECGQRCEASPGCEVNQRCCPGAYPCDLTTGRCTCTADSCPEGKSCEPVTGACLPPDAICDPPCSPPSVCVDNACVPHEEPGGPCFVDSECDATQGYLCDSAVGCAECVAEDPAFTPEFVCRVECSLVTRECSHPAYTCKLRRPGPTGLCVP
ncbi:MAG TPA: hypothetical protein PK668_26065 [Myxococcota bacterium]|nr:hypothetical protein [Myxococcota bacterium]HRY96992.1 hypothetical protein [Myxococcota bacterium]